METLNGIQDANTVESQDVSKGKKHKKELTVLLKDDGTFVIYMKSNPSEKLSFHREEISAEVESIALRQGITDKLSNATSTAEDNEERWEMLKLAKSRIIDQGIWNTKIQRAEISDRVKTTLNNKLDSLTDEELEDIGLDREAAIAMLQKLAH